MIFYSTNIIVVKNKHAILHLEESSAPQATIEISWETSENVLCLLPSWSGVRQRQPLLLYILTISYSICYLS